MKTLERNEKCGNSMRYTYKITPIYVDNCPRVANLISNLC